MKIEIFGPGCAKCEKTAREVERAVKELGVDATVEHVTEMSEIVGRGVMLTPAVFSHFAQPGPNISIFMVLKPLCPLTSGERRRSFRKASP